MGITMQLPIDERHGYTRDYVEGRLGILMGGRSAEMLIFNQMTTGAGNDIEQATEIARKMVVEWGMRDLLGPMTFGKKNEEIFLGREIQSHRDYSDVTARMIDEEISRIVRDAQRISEEILRKDIDLLNRLAKELLKYETVTSDDLDKIIKGQKLTRRRNGQSRQKPRQRTPGKSRRKVHAKQNKAGLRKPGNQSQSKQKKKQPAKK